MKNTGKKHQMILQHENLGFWRALLLRNQCFDFKLLLDLARGAKMHKFVFYKKFDFIFEISSNLGSKNAESKLFFVVFRA